MDDEEQSETEQPVEVNISPEEAVICFTPEVEDHKWTGKFQIVSYMLNPRDYDEEDRDVLFPMDTESRQRWEDFIQLWAAAPFVIEQVPHLAQSLRAVVEPHLQEARRQAHEQAVHDRVVAVEGNVAFVDFESRGDQQ